MNSSAFYKITYGLYIVTSWDGENFNGHISNTVFQITADPAWFAVGSHKKNLTTEYIQKSKVFTISVLQQDVDMKFLGPWGFQSGRDIDKFAAVDYRVGKTGAPIILDNTIAFIENEVESVIDTGTHILFIGKVVDAGILDEHQAPLTYAFYRNVIKGLSPENAPTYTGDKLAQEGGGSDKVALKEAQKMKKYRCSVCGYVYDPEAGDPPTGIPPGTAFEDIPDDWSCPVCGVLKKDFEVMD